MLLKILSIFQFIIFYLFQLLQANVQIALITLLPRLKAKSAFIRVPLTLKSDFGLLLFSNLVSMTPGSLVTDIDSDRKMATVHVIFLSSEKEISKEVKNMQNRIKRMTH